MIIICETKATETQIVALQQKIRDAGLEVHRSDGVEHTVLGAAVTVDGVAVVALFIRTRTTITAVPDEAVR